MKKKQDRTQLTYFSLRNAKRESIEGIRRLARKWKLTVEQTANVVMEVGLGMIEKKGGKK
jgi:hypothetical protein